MLRCGTAAAQGGGASVRPVPLKSVLGESMLFVPIGEGRALYP